MLCALTILGFHWSSTLNEWLANSHMRKKSITYEQFYRTQYFDYTCMRVFDLVSSWSLLMAPHHRFSDLQTAVFYALIALSCSYTTALL